MWLTLRLATTGLTWAIAPATCADAVKRGAMHGDPSTLVSRGRCWMSCVEDPRPLRSPSGVVRAWKVETYGAESQERLFATWKKMR